MKTYPICLVDMGRRRAVVVGGGDVAARKVRELLDVNASITVISPALTPELRALINGGRIGVIPRRYLEGDLAGAFLVIAATDNAKINQMVWREANQLGCLVNVVDDPAHCAFITPAVVRRGDVTIAISTGGTSPALATRLRERIEELIGPEYGQLANLLAELRSQIQSRYASQPDRARVAFRLIDSDLVTTIRQKGLDEARVQAQKILQEDS